MNMKKIYMQLSDHIVRVCLSILIVIAAAQLTACGQNAASSTADYIGIDAAKEAALKAADIPADQTVLLAAGLDSKNGTFYYQVIFHGNGMEYEYDIDAMTGVVIEEKHTPLQAENQADTDVSSSQESAAAQENEAPQESTVSQGDTAAQESEASQAGTASQQSAVNSPTAAAGIDSDTAFAIALSHAGLAETDVTFHQVKEDIEDGRRIFEVEFMTSDGTEYDYELSADDGTVLSYDYDAEYQFRDTPAAGAGMISEEQAKQTVLERVPGASASDILIRLEEDDGRMEYEGRLFYDNTEYEFKIDAYSGGLIEWEAESVTG